MSVLSVGSGQQFASLKAAVAASHDGDVLQVQAGTYVNDFATVNTKITIEGVGGMVHLLATQSPPDGKAILTTSTDVTLDDIEFSGAQVNDGNGAGVRYQGGNLTIHDCYFHDNQDGLLSADTGGTGSISIYDSEFANNGTGDGHTHNLYVGDIGSLSIDGSYFHDAIVGHEIKSRAEATTITNSRVQDGSNGTASYSIDLPNGGNALIQGDVIEQGPASQNPAIITFGEEGGVHANSSLTVTGNTILNDLQSPSASAVWNATGAPATVTGNAIFGLPARQVTVGSAKVSGNTVLQTEPALVTTSPWAAAPATAPVSNPAAPSPTPAAPASDPTGTSSGPAAPTPTPAVTDTLVLHLSEDMYQGDAQFVASVDGQQLGAAQSVTALHGLGQTADFTFTGQFGAGPHDLGVSFLNDLWAGTPSTDRNLYVNSVDLDGTHYASATAALYTASTVHLQIGAAPST